MAYNKTNWVNDQTELNAENMNHIENGISNAYNVSLLAVTDTAPSECSTGDKYYNTETGLIYTATGTNTWGTTGEEPISDILYIVLEERTSYTYDGTDLISVGGGAGGSVIVAPDEPTEDTKLYIESTDLDFQGEIVDDIYSTSEIKTNKIWIDGKPIYRKVISSTLNGTYTESGNRYTWIDSSLSNVNILKIDFIATLSDRYLVNIDSTLIANVSYILTGANANKIQVGSNVSGVAINTPIDLILEYTKSN